MAPRAMLAVAFGSVARAYEALDHSWGESFPGKQRPTTQLSLRAMWAPPKPKKAAKRKAVETAEATTATKAKRATKGEERRTD